VNVRDSVSRRDSASLLILSCDCPAAIPNTTIQLPINTISCQGYALLDKELFVPEIWFTEKYEEKRDKCKFPMVISFKTKPQLAVRMVDDIVENNLIPVKYVVANSIYGNSPKFIEQVERYTGKIYFLGVSSKTKCWLRMPKTFEKEYIH
jgi:SRSO17 transposase